MELRNFIKEHLPEGEADPDFLRYSYLKRQLKDREEINSTEQGIELFREFLQLKDKLFDRAMNNWLRRREE